MRKYLLDELFPPPKFVKPRELRQTWLKDLGFQQDQWGGRMGLAELADFLKVAAPRLDYVKLLPAQVITCPRDWFTDKVTTYLRYGVIPYFDHGYFKMAHSLGKLDPAIAAARELGVPALEFMNDESLSVDRYRELMRRAREYEIEVIFEFHPFHKFDPSTPTVAGTAEDILRAAAPCLELGATKLMIDHLEYDTLKERAGEELGKVVKELGLERVVFEVESPTWRQHLEGYLELFGPEANLANFTPEWVMQVEPARQQAAVTHQRP